MADISFYKYLEASFRYRLFDPRGGIATPDTHFNDLGYNLTYKQIFYYARKVLPKFYTGEFSDTQEGNLQMAKKVLEKLDKHQDIQLENQFKAVTVSEENARIIAQAQAESQQIEAQQAQLAGESSGTSFGGMPAGLPSAPSISSAPRVRIVQQTQPPGGMEGGTGQGTAATNKSMRIAERQEIEKSEISSSHPPTPSRINFSAFKSSISSGFKKVQNFASPVGPFLKINLGRIGKGLGEMARGLGRGVFGPALSGGANLMGRGLLGGVNRGANFYGRFSRLKSSLNRPSFLSKSSVGKKGSGKTGQTSGYPAGKSV